MAGKQQPRLTKSSDFKDPFNAGQLVGMMVILSFIEKNGGISADIIYEINQTCANNLQNFLEKPAEDIFLMIDSMVEEIQLQ